MSVSHSQPDNRLVDPVTESNIRELQGRVDSLANQLAAARSRADALEKRVKELEGERRTDAIGTYAL